MNPIVVAAEVLERFHAPATNRRYAAFLAGRIVAVDRGEFASDETVGQFFTNYAE